MKSFLTIILSVLTFQISFGQVATIQDSDGWTNVRKESNGQSEIIYRINEGELFWFDFEFESNNTDWIEIYIPKDKFCTHGYNGEMTTGFIHKSRLLALERLNPYEGTGFLFEYFVSDFDSIGKNIEYQDGKWPISINGKHMWGTDGYLPYSEIDSIKILIENKTIRIDQNLYDDLFNLQDEINIYKIKNVFVVYHWNSDGAGAYELAWVIDKKGILQRLVGTII